MAFLYSPREFCLMDDDVFILERVDEAMEAFEKHNPVYTTNEDLSKDYMKTWENVYKQSSSSLATGTLNVGLYWLRNTKDPRMLAEKALQLQPQDILSLDWEQGFIAISYVNESCFDLPTQRYLAPVVDGFPGGAQGYASMHNPCGFVSIHFMGLIKSGKHSDGWALRLAPQILQREANYSIFPNDNETRCTAAYFILTS